MTDETQNEIFARNLKRLLAESGKQQRDMAEDLGIRESAISNWVCGRAMPKMSRIQEIADYFGVGKSDLIEDIPYSRSVKIPVYGSVAAGLPITANQDIVGFEEIPAEMFQTGEYMCLNIKGDSMEPRIYDGDSIIVRIQPDAESGEIVVAGIGRDDAVCKKLRKRDDGIVLVSLNSQYEPMYFTNEDIKDLPIKLYGKVVEIRGKMKGI